MDELSNLVRSATKLDLRQSKGLVEYRAVQIDGG
jgi:hypothetical protein